MLATILTTFVVGMALLILPSKAVEAYRVSEQSKQSQTTEHNTTVEK